MSLKLSTISWSKVKIRVHSLLSHKLHKWATNPNKSVNSHLKIHPLISQGKELNISNNPLKFKIENLKLQTHKICLPKTKVFLTPKLQFRLLMRQNNKRDFLILSNSMKWEKALSNLLNCKLHFQLNQIKSSYYISHKN